jgi:hypothetical protein
MGGEQVRNFSTKKTRMLHRCVPGNRFTKGVIVIMSPKAQAHWFNNRHSRPHSGQDF